MIVRRRVSIPDEVRKTLHRLHDEFGRDTSKTQSIRGGTQISLKEVGGVVFPFLGELCDFRERMGVWSIRMSKGGFHQLHNHPNGETSGVCYVDVPDSESGRLQIYANPFEKPIEDIRPEVGLVVTFPSYVWHGTTTYEGLEPRLTIACDKLPEGN